MAGNVEFLAIPGQQLHTGLAADGGGEDQLAQCFQGNIGDPGHPLGSLDIPVGAGGGLEHDRIRQNGSCHEARHIGSGDQTPLPEHVGNDGIGGAYRLVAQVNGVGGFNIGDPVMVNDGQNLRFIQTGHRLSRLIVVHQHHTLAPGAQQMIPVHHTHNLVFFIQNGVAGFLMLQHFFLGKFHPVISMEHRDVLGPADPSDGGGLENQPGCPVGIEGCRDDTGFGGEIAQLLRQLRFTQHQAVDIHLQSLANQLRLVAADHDGIGSFPLDGFLAPGQGDDHIAEDGIGGLTGLVEDGAFQHGQHIKEGYFLQIAFGDQIHVVSSHMVAGEDAVEGSVLVGHRQGGNILFLHHIPGPAHSHCGAEDGGLQEIQIPDLVVHIIDALGGCKSEAVQNDLGLVGGFTQTGGLEFTVAAGIAQGRIGQCCHDGVRIGVSVSGNINRIHKATSCYCCIFRHAVTSPARFCRNSSAISGCSIPWPMAHISLVMAASDVMSRPWMTPISRSLLPTW